MNTLVPAAEFVWHRVYGLLNRDYGFPTATCLTETTVLLLLQSFIGCNLTAKASITVNWKNCEDF